MRSIPHAGTPNPVDRVRIDDAIESLRCLRGRSSCNGHSAVVRVDDVFEDFLDLVLCAWLE
jgi:hypothetical protein